MSVPSPVSVPSPAARTAGRPGGVRGPVVVSILILLAGSGLWGLISLKKKARPETAGPSETAAPADGILHQWNFDEAKDWHDSPFESVPNTPVEVLDLAGGLNARPAGLSGRDWVSGREFMAVRLDGSSWLDTGRDLSPVLGRTATLACWLRTSATGGASAADSPGLAGATGGEGQTRKDIQWGWLDGEGRLNVSAGGQLLARSSKPVNDDRWHFVLLSRDAESGAGRILVDGVPGESHTGPAGPLDFPFRSIGRLEAPAPGTGRGFVGRLDKVTVFNRPVDDTEATAFMENHAPKTWPVTTAGPAGKPFVTGSALVRGYDAERDTLSVRRWTQPARGAVVHIGDGSFAYTPEPGFAGMDRFYVVVQDGRGGFHRSTVTVSVEPSTPGGGVPTTQFTAFRTLQAGGRDMAYRGWRVPEVVDWDGDGQPDLLVGAGGGVWFHRNTGTASSPAFADGVRLKADGRDIESGDGISPIALADLTGDGAPDLALADSSGKLRIYRIDAGKGRDTALTFAGCAKTPDGSEFVLPDRRFDLGDWNVDGRPDLVTGTRSGEGKLFLNAGPATEPRFDRGETLFSGSYNLYPRFCDLDRNGRMDLARGINWGGVSYWLDVGERQLTRGGELAIGRAGGGNETLRDTDGAVVDVADLDADGIPDLVIGGQAGDRVFIATGVRRGVADYLREIEDLYDAHPDDLGKALSANDGALLNRVNDANRGLANLIANGSPDVRAEAYAALAAHVRKYPFLRRGTLDTNAFHHVPSLALQNWVFLRYARPDTPNHRREVADLLDLSGTARDIFLESGLALGDNGRLNEAQLGAVRDFMRRHPRELFPDCLITFDQLYGDGRGGLVWTPDSCKNTFGCDVGNANEWARDLTEAIEAVEGKGAAHGDYFTFVMGHEVTHSLDHYVRTRANRDLARRWGRMLCRAAGPDVAPGADGWPDWNATRRRFEQAGHYKPGAQTWEQAWEAYWKSGPGSAFRNLSFMRGGIDWFLHAPQESLATQANHHWANAAGRLIAAVARFRKGVETGNAPMKANLTEVVDFIDYQSAGMNRVALPKTATEKETVKKVVWTISLADLERDDRGRITGLDVAGRRYEFALDDDGAVRDVRAP